MSDDIVCQEDRFCFMNAPQMDSENVPSDLNVLRKNQEKTKKRRRRTVSGGGKIKGGRVSKPQATRRKRVGGRRIRRKRTAIKKVHRRRRGRKTR